MNITFLGTSAATAIPMPFCKCQICETARERKGKDLRKRTSLLVNDDLLIDFGPDVMSASFMYDIDTTKIKHLLQTHPHTDHFDASAFGTRFPGYAVEDVPHLELYASARTVKKLNEMLRDDGYVQDITDPKEQEELKLSVFQMSHFEKRKVGNYTVTALPANHDEAVDALLYIVEDENTSLFYGTDTDTLPDELWSYLEDQKISFDFVILDQTYGPDLDGDSHLNANKLIETAQRMKESGMLKDGARVFATHLSHEGNYNHRELSEYAAKHGYEIAHDGLVVSSR